MKLIYIITIINVILYTRLFKLRREKKEPSNKPTICIDSYKEPTREQVLKSPLFASKWFSKDDLTIRVKL
jgi:hypothetical protein